MPRSLNSKSWIKRHLSDPYVKKSQRDGYRARSAYKLLELDRDHGLLKPGQVVVDLGSAPGGWAQVCVKAGGPSGKVVAIDILEMAPLHGVRILQADFSADAGLASLIETLDGKACDLVLSDMAPNLTGIALTDQVRMFHLAELALEFCEDFLRPGGDFVVKVFQGSGYSDYVKALRLAFTKANVVKPAASRAESGELYLVGKGKRGPARKV